MQQCPGHDRIEDEAGAEGHRRAAERGPLRSRHVARKNGWHSAQDQMTHFRVPSGLFIGQRLGLHP